ncbi:hypothetical protein [Winogradskyella sp. PC D3.3]
MKTNIRVISTDGGDFGCFFEIEDLYAKLSGVKDTYGENMEFIEIGNHIQLNDNLLKVVDINLKFENIDLTTKHFNKSKNSTPKNLIIEMIITVEFVKKIKTFANTVYN